MFCSLFDEALANEGPAAIFLFDPDGLLRFDARWTRDCWGRAEGPHALRPTWLLLRDRGSGWVTQVFCSSPTLLAEHPRLDVRAFRSQEEARVAREAFGAPPLATEPW